jgi:hypothetical protein
MKHFLPASFTRRLLYLLFTALFFSCGNSNTIPYPQPLPDSTALVFLPHLVSKDSLDFNAVFSPDGQSFFFSRSLNKQSNMYVSKYNGTNWTEPTLLPVSVTHYSDADPAFAPDGKLYFISNRPTNPSDTTKDYDIWFSSPLAGGGWSVPENLTSVNSDSNEFYVSFSDKGHLYFASSRKGGFGEEDIYVSKWINGQYTTPANLGKPSIPKNQSMTPLFQPKKSCLFLLLPTGMILLGAQTCIALNRVKIIHGGRLLTWVSASIPQAGIFVLRSRPIQNISSSAVNAM